MITYASESSRMRRYSCTGLVHDIIALLATAGDPAPFNGVLVVSPPPLFIDLSAANQHHLADEEEEEPQQQQDDAGCCCPPAMILVVMLPPTACRSKSRSPDKRNSKQTARKMTALVHVLDQQRHRPCSFSHQRVPPDNKNHVSARGNDSLLPLLYFILVHSCKEGPPVPANSKK
jgi:hypothetical protein